MEVERRENEMPLSSVRRGLSYSTQVFRRQFGYRSNTASLAVPTLPDKQKIINELKEEFETSEESLENADVLVQKTINKLRSKRNERIKLYRKRRVEVAREVISLLSKFNYTVICQTRQFKVQEANERYEEYNWFENEYVDIFDRFVPTHRIEDNIMNIYRRFQLWCSTRPESDKKIIKSTILPVQNTWPHEQYQPSSGSVNLADINPDSKAKLFVTSCELSKVLNDEQILILRQIVGPRWDPEKDILKLTFEEHDTQFDNHHGIQMLLYQLIRKTEEVYVAQKKLRNEQVEELPPRKDIY